MRRAALLYNPMSGQNHRRRSAVIADVAAVFEAAGVAVQMIPTTSAGSAGLLAQQAVRDGCDTIVICGGDGTVHEALQGMVGSAGAALGVIPLGTANALAADLGLPRNPVKAAKMLLGMEPMRVPVGRVFFRDGEGGAQSRYFVVAAGVGVDAHFFSQLDSGMKQRYGYAAYFVEAMRLWATHTFQMFTATFTGCEDGALREEDVSQLMAVRVSTFGGLVRKLVPGAALGNDRLRVIAFKTSRRLQYLRFMVAVWFGRHTYAGAIELVECDELECRDIAGSAVRSMVEADGELLGYLPVRIEVVPDALTLLASRNRPARVSNSSTPSPILEA